MLRLQIFQEDPDIAAMLGLWSAVYPSKPAPKQYFNWRYLNSEFPATTINVYDGTKLAGSHSYLRLPARVFGAATSAAGLFDTLIHPSYQKRGLVVPLFLELDRLMTAAGISVKFGFPNLKLVSVVSAVPKWSCLRPMPVLTAPVELLAGRSACTEFSVSEEGVGSTLPREGVHLLADGEMRGSYSFSIRRTPELYSWRLSSESGRAYQWRLLRSGKEATAVVIYKLFHDATGRPHIVDVVDFAVKSPELLGSALATLAREWKALGVKSVSAWSGSGISATDLRRNGFQEAQPYWQLAYSGDRQAMDSPLLTFLDSDVF